MLHKASSQPELMDFPMLSFGDHSEPQPVLDVTPETVTAKIGSTALLPCTVRNRAEFDSVSLRFCFEQKHSSDLCIYICTIMYLV